MTAGFFRPRGFNHFGENISHNPRDVRYLSRISTGDGSWLQVAVLAHDTIHDRGLVVNKRIDEVEGACGRGFWVAVCASTSTPSNPETGYLDCYLAPELGLKP